MAVTKQDIQQLHAKIISEIPPCFWFFLDIDFKVEEKSSTFSNVEEISKKRKSLEENNTPISTKSYPYLLRKFAELQLYGKFEDALRSGCLEDYDNALFKFSDPSKSEFKQQNNAPAYNLFTFGFLSSVRESADNYKTNIFIFTHHMDLHNILIPFALTAIFAPIIFPFTLPCLFSIMELCAISAGTFLTIACTLGSARDRLNSIIKNNFNSFVEEQEKNVSERECVGTRSATVRS